MINQCIKDFRKLKDNKRAKINERFFKTGPGEYGEGDKFLGIRMPLLREFAKNYYDLKTDQIEKLISSSWHEERMLGFIILVKKYELARKKNKSEATKIYKFFIKNKKYLNNWDLVDVTVPNIVGVELYDKPREKLYTWARNKNLWTRRISILATFHFIKNRDFQDTIKLSEILINDTEDLMHKAVGWMLREVGKRDRKLLDKFLENYQFKMPRTMLRYAIEKHPEAIRKNILKGNFKT